MSVPAGFSAEIVNPEELPKRSSGGNGTGKWQWLIDAALEAYNAVDEQGQRQGLKVQAPDQEQATKGKWALDRRAKKGMFPGVKAVISTAKNRQAQPDANGNHPYWLTVEFLPLAD